MEKYFILLSLTLVSTILLLQICTVRGLKLDEKKMMQCIKDDHEHKCMDLIMSKEFRQMAEDDTNEEKNKKLLKLMTTRCPSLCDYMDKEFQRQYPNRGK